jgi:hypothetical protein
MDQELIDLLNSIGIEAPKELLDDLDFQMRNASALEFADAESCPMRQRIAANTNAEGIMGLNAMLETIAADTDNDSVMDTQHAIAHWVMGVSHQSLENAMTLLATLVYLCIEQDKRF